MRQVAPAPRPPSDTAAGDGREPGSGRGPGRGSGRGNDRERADEQRRALEAERRHAAEHRRWHQRCRRVAVRRSRWVRPSDVLRIDGVPTLTPVATAISLAATHPDEVRAFLIDARQAGKLNLSEVRDRLASIGTIRGRHAIVAALAALEDRTPESVFHDEVLDVLEQRGYRPRRSAIRLVTPRGRAVLPDIPLEAWKVAIELDGDRYHRDREARRRDRDRLSAYASTDWVPLVVDHRSWTQRRDEVMSDIDEAILAQRRRGIGAEVPLPPHLASRELGG